MLQGATQQKWPVVIVGAGPVGMLLALLLARRQIRSLLIEKRVGALAWSRAIGITPPSLAILAKAGLDRAFVADGVKVTEAVVHDDCGIAGNVRFDRLDSEHQFILALPQSTTLAILTAAIEASPYVAYRRGLELVTLEQRDGIVEAGLRRGDGAAETTLQAEWLIGCDGARSTVRDLLRVGTTRKQYPTRFVMADFADNTCWGRQAHLFFTKHGSLESFPLPAGQRRWVASVTRSAGGLTLEHALTDQAKTIGNVQLDGGRSSPVFDFQPERVDVARLYCGRAMLAGDAAHVMSPIGGQGMNTGLADAALLAETLSGLLAAGPSAAALVRYDRSRRRAALAATRRAAVGMWVGTRTGALASAIRAKTFRHLLLRPPLLQRLPPHVAMLTIPGHRTGVT